MSQDDVCSCGQVKGMIEIFACERCGGNCCIDCSTDCYECEKMICVNCLDELNNIVCSDCASDLVDNVNLMVNGKTFPVKAYDYSLISYLVEKTNPALPLDKKIGTMRVSGLGLLKYKFRTILIGRGKVKDEYFLYFDKIEDDLPWENKA